MTNHNSYGRRKLPFPYSYLTVQTQSSPELNTGNDPTPEYNFGGFNFYVLVLDSDEQLKFTSSLQAGADLIYPDIQLDVQSQWLYAREFPNDFTGGGLVSICAALVDCINTNQAVQDSLTALLAQGGGSFPAQGVDTIVGTDNPLYSDENLLSDIDCNDNAIAGACLELIQALDGLAIDWIEGFQAAALPYELAGYVFQSNPLAAQLGVDSGDLVDWLTDEVKTQYEAAVTPSLINEAAKLLYDASCVDCDLTVDTLFSVFAQESSISINPATAWRNFIEDIITINVGAGLVYAMWGFMCATWKIGGVFDGLSGVSVLKYAIDSSTPIDPSIIGASPCNPSNTWQIEFDFTVANCGFSAIANRGSYVGGVGFVSQFFNANEEAIYFLKDYGTTQFTLTSVVQNQTMNTPSGAALRQYTLLGRPPLGNIEVVQQFSDINLSVVDFSSVSPVTPYTTEYLRTQVYLTGTQATSEVVVTSLVIQGTGTPPETNNPPGGITLTYL